jgi:phage regulator Rha-like protein
VSLQPNSESVADIVSRITVIRGQRVLLGSDLAVLYGVTTKQLTQQVRRNSDRFPTDFAFQLNEAEASALRSQIVTLESGRGRHSKYRPWAFTEHGALMVATVLSSKRAVEMTVYVVRAFVRLRKLLASHAELARELETIKRSVATLDADTRRQFDQVYEAILGLMGTKIRQ